MQHVDRRREAHRIGSPKRIATVIADNFDNTGIARALESLGRAMPPAVLRHEQRIPHLGFDFFRENTKVLEA